jgi:hypothetical protein
MAATIKVVHPVLMSSDPDRSIGLFQRLGFRAVFKRGRVRSARLVLGAERRALGLTSARLVVLCSALLAVSAQAGQEWELISVTRGPTWEVNEAKGALKRNGRVLEGTLRDKTDGKADYQIRIELNGEQVKATFRFVSESDDGTTLTGIYKRTAKPTKTHCPEQIQLMNAFQYVGLARNTCEP